MWLSRYREKFRSPMPEREEVPVSQSPDLSSDTDVYCFCRRPDDSRRMVQCDQCDGWFHGECVGVTTQEVADLDQYICPSCMGNGSWIRCLLLSFSGSSDEDIGSPTCGWADERQRYRSKGNPGEPSEEPSRSTREPPEEPSACPGEQGSPPEEAGQHRPMRRGTRESRCPIPGCRFRTRKMRVHVSVSHLHPCTCGRCPAPRRLRGPRRRDWLRLCLLGPGTSLLDMSARVPAGEVFTSPADMLW